MKKIVFIILCFFGCAKLASASYLVSEETPYYVKISKYNMEEKIINIKKIYDQETLDVVFNIDCNNYDIHSKFNTYLEYDKSIWKGNLSSVDYFTTIIYYGYLNNPNDKNYFLTQLLVWELISNYRIKITNQFGEEINNYNKEYQKIRANVINHTLVSSIFNQTYDTEIWTKNTYKYDINAIILDNPVVKGLSIKTIDRNIVIDNEKVGNYNLNFKKEYKQQYKCYSDGVNVYWQSLEGPRSIEYGFNYNVYGTKLNIKENLIGINNRLGDAYLDSKYELYLDNELKLIISEVKDIYVKSNSNYTLKDVSNASGIINTPEINFKVENEEFTLFLEKQVISKNISIDINDNKTYYIYLKSNNELYEEINRDTNVITLPYGLYYIKSMDNNYYKEITIKDSIDEVLVINNKINTNSELKNEYLEKNYYEVENPKTLDDISTHIFNFFLSLVIIICQALSSLNIIVDKK